MKLTMTDNAENAMYQFWYGDPWQISLMDLVYTSVWRSETPVNQSVYTIEQLNNKFGMPKKEDTGILSVCAVCNLWNVMWMFEM